MGAGAVGYERAGAPWLLRRRSLLFRTLLGVAAMRISGLGLKVTFRGTLLRRRGLVSVIVDMVEDGTPR